MVEAAARIKTRPRSFAVERTHYAVGAGKRTALALALLAVLPFALSVPVMAYQRWQHGLLFDLPSLAVVGLCLSIVAALLAVQLMHAIRAKLTLGERGFLFTLPRGRGSAPLLHYSRQGIAYQDIAEVELRRELFGGSVMPVVLQGAHVITRKGVDVLLGYVSEDNPDDSFPFIDIAHQLAERAEAPLIEEPGVWKTLYSRTQAKAEGLIAGDSRRVDQAELDRLDRNHRRFGIAVVNVVLAIVLVGIAMDYADAARSLPSEPPHVHAPSVAPSSQQ